MVRNIKISLYSEKSFEFFLSNIKGNLDNIRGAVPGWVDRFMSENNQKPIGEFSFPDLKLKYDPKDRPGSDYKCAVELYTKLKFIDKFQSSNGMIWTMISMNYLDYLNARNKIAESDTEATADILKNFCCPWNPGKRDLARCTLSSLWRIVDLTVDDSRGPDKRFDLTREAFKNTDMMQSLTDRVPFMNREVVRGVLEFSLSRSRLGNELDKIDYQQLAVHINSVAGTTRIDMLNASDVFNLCSAFMDWFVLSGEKAKHVAKASEQNRKNATKASDPSKA